MRPDAYFKRHIKVLVPPSIIDLTRERVKQANGLTYRDDPDCKKWVIPQMALYKARDDGYRSGFVPKLKQTHGEFSEDGYHADFDVIGWYDVKGRK